MTAKVPMQRTRLTIRLTMLWALLVLVLLGLNLRPLITSPGPLLPALRDLTGMSFGVASLVTSLAVLMFGVCGLFSTQLIQRLGYRHGIGLGLLAIGLAAMLRAIPPSTVLLMFTAWLGGVGIALLQIIIPEVTKHQFGQRLSAITGLWSAALMGGAALGAVFSPMLAELTTPWYASLSWWALLAVFAAALWYAPLTSVPTHTPSLPTDHLHPHRFRRAWLLGAYFALINGGYAGIITWLAPFYQEFGWSTQQSGNLLAFFCVAQVIGALLFPAIARGTDRRLYLYLAVVAQLIGFGGLWLAPETAPWVWAGACGFGLGATFPLAIVGALDHLSRPGQAGRLAAFMQGIGFLFAASTPFITGLLRDLTGLYATGWLLHVIMALALIGLTQLFNPASYSAAFAHVKTR